MFKGDSADICAGKFQQIVSASIIQHLIKLSFFHLIVTPCINYTTYKVIEYGSEQTTLMSHQ